MPSASFNISSKFVSPCYNFTEEICILESQLRTLQHGFLVNYSKDLEVSYFYVFNLRKNMRLLNVTQIREKFTRLQNEKCWHFIFSKILRKTKRKLITESETLQKQSKFRS